MLIKIIYIGGTSVKLCVSRMLPLILANDLLCKKYAGKNSGRNWLRPFAKSSFFQTALLKSDLPISTINLYFESFTFKVKCMCCTYLITYE